MEYKLKITSFFFHFILETSYHSLLHQASPRTHGQEVNQGKGAKQTQILWPTTQHIRVH